tara:strand:+ start:159 stop:548 length:390 start_codon:yes stop_codon:yes gene_type:complete
MQNNKVQMGSNKSFGFIFFIFFLLISLWPITNGKEINYLILSISFIFLLLTLFNSKYLTPLNKLWFKIGLILGRFISPIVMGIIFFLVVTPIAIIMKILGKDILGIKKNNKKTYWVNKTGPKSKMKNQF